MTITQLLLLLLLMMMMMITSPRAAPTAQSTSFNTSRKHDAFCRGNFS